MKGVHVFALVPDHEVGTDSHVTVPEGWNSINVTGGKIFTKLVPPSGDFAIDLKASSTLRDYLISEIKIQGQSPVPWTVRVDSADVLTHLRVISRDYFEFDCSYLDCKVILRHNVQMVGIEGSPDLFKLAELINFMERLRRTSLDYDENRELIGFDKNSLHKLVHHFCQDIDDGLAKGINKDPLSASPDAIAQDSHHLNLSRRKLAELLGYVEIEQQSLLVNKANLEQILASDPDLLEFILNGTKVPYAQMEADLTFAKIRLQTSNFALASNDQALNLKRLQIERTIQGVLFVVAVIGSTALLVPDKGWGEVWPAEKDVPFVRLVIAAMLGAGCLHFWNRTWSKK